ncbi:DUF2274 domain-containing protein [Halomonas qaidamensis]|uniref:DUF2274 domain-containing protein n=1 Tax=Halomonas qaidamensis TaxID=2866211 RepID=A0ABY6JV81_9GAMM|nr:DUF2274 domain-containing protein [Halomonas qaidamensis]UYV20892.1 DUF2274 domain-containing protein [Halomonas qaidamensis]
MDTTQTALGALPKTIWRPTSLKADLDRCSVIHAKAYGNAVNALLLIQHMFEACMVGDWDFERG